MNKREFISNTTALLIGLTGGTSTSARAATLQSGESEVILTLTGAITRTNRGRFDPMADQLMYKQGIRFDRAYQFTLADLAKLPALSIRPTMEYDARVHQLSGPRLKDVLNVAGVNGANAKSIIFHGIDGYSPQLTLSLALQYDFILATHIDDSLLHIGGFGPLFAIYDADRIREIAQKPLAERFTACPWGLYCIEVV
jgi:hypothetical protein